MYQEKNKFPCQPPKSPVLAPLLPVPPMFPSTANTEQRRHGVDVSAVHENGIVQAINTILTPNIVVSGNLY